MLDALLAFTLLAAAAPKVAYTPNPAGAADIGTVALTTPRRNACFGVVRAAVLLSSRKADRSRAYALTVILADSVAPAVITDGALGEAPLKVVNVRNGDVACTDYQCPTGSAAVFEISAAQRQAMLAAGALPLVVKTNLNTGCGLEMSVDKAAVEALDAWADRLPAAG
jgi:hypothetical protein